MLPKFLQSSYSRYKNDTDSFATWLLEAASKCGYEPDSLTSAVHSTDKKGKKGEKPKTTDSSSEPVRYTTTIKDLQLLADVVAKSTLTVPRPVLALAKRAIKLRKSVTSWFLGKGNTEETKRHAHFISVLEGICEILEWKTTKSSDSDTRQSSATETDDVEKDMDLFLNKFAVLTVEEPTDSQEPHQTPSQPKTLVKVETLENEDAGEEAKKASRAHFVFKTFCMFQDLHAMRAFISRTWAEYRDKEIDLMNAAVVTDSALQLAKDLVQEVLADWTGADFLKLDDDDDDIQQIVFDTARMTRGISAYPSLEVGLPFNKNMADVAEWCYIPTQILLESFADILEDDHVPVFKKGHFGTYDPKAIREKMSVGERFDEDKILLLQLLPEFCALKTFGVQMLVSDSITSGLIEFCKTKKCTPWLCFAAQILLDVHHIMRHSPLSALDDLRMSGLRIQKTVDEYLKLTKTHPQPAFWPKEGDEEIENIKFNVEWWVLQDPLFEIRKRTMKRQQVPEKHELWSQHSILCGLTLFHLNRRMQTVGQMLVTQWYDVQQLAFLYNLVTKASAHTRLSWPDMDTFIKIHGEAHIFVGSRPNNASDSLNRLELTTGISSATNFASDSRQRGPFHRPNGKNPRLLKPTTTVSNLFSPLYVDTGDDGGIGHIDKILDTLSREYGVQPTSTVKDIQKSDPQLMLQQKWTNTRNIGILQLLALVKTRLFEEEPVLLFNYFGMHKRCIELLRLIKRKEHHKFCQYFTTSYMPNESFISNLVILVHHVARGSAQNAQAMGLLSGTGLSSGSRIVQSCGDVMQEYLAKNGNVACKELRVFCRNKTAIQDEIDHGTENEKLNYWFSLEETLDPKVMASLMTGIPIA